MGGFIETVNSLQENIEAIKNVNNGIALINENIEAIKNASINAKIIEEDKNIIMSISNELSNLTVQAISLLSSEDAFVDYNKVSGILKIGIPKGLKGDIGEAFKVNAQGTIADRSLYDGSANGFSYLSTDTTPTMIYFKKSDNSADWTEGSPFGKGDIGIGIKNIIKTDGTGEAGTEDTYTVYLEDDSIAGTFIVKNGSVTTKSDLGLDKVDNTSDMEKPISNAVRDALENIDQKFEYLQTDTPILSGDTTKGEGLILTLTIDNQSPTATYNIDVEAGSYVFENPYIYWTLPIFSGVDDEHNISVVSREEGFLPSIPSLHTVTVLDLGDGGTIDYQGATMNETTFATVMNVDLTGNTLLATSDNAVAISNKITETNTITVLSPTMDSKALNFDIYKSGADNTNTISAIENHTSNVGIYGTISADSEANPAYNAVNGNTSNNWDSAGTSAQLDYIFSSAGYAFDKVRIAGHSTIGRSPKDFTVKFSNTGAFSGEEITPINEVGITDWIAQGYKDFTFYSDGTIYKYMRLTISANNGDASYTGISGIQLIKSQAQYSNTSVTISGQLLIEGQKVLLNDGASVDLIEFDTTGIFTLDTLKDAIETIGSNVTLLNNDLTVQTVNNSSFANNNAYGPIIDNGNVYFEVKIDAYTSDIFIGVSKVNTYQSSYFANTTDGYGYRIDLGSTYNNGSVISSGDATITTNDVIGIRYNHTTGELEFYKNGVSQGVNAILPAGTNLFPACDCYYNSAILTFRFKEEDLEYKPVDTTALAYDTYTIDITSASLTNAPTIVTKDVPTISTSLVDTGSADSFVERSLVSATADLDTIPTIITTIFDTDTRQGTDVIHKVEMNNGDEVSRITTDVQILL